MLKIRDIVASACKAVSVDDLTNSEYEQLSAISKILEMYKNLIKKLESRDAKISKVVPVLSSLKKFLSLQANGTNKNFCDKLLEDFEKRFGYIFDSNCLEFCNIFLIATALDIDQRKYLRIKALSEQRKFIEKYLVKCTTQQTSGAFIDLQQEEFPELVEDADIEPEVESEYTRFSRSICAANNDAFWVEAKANLPILYEVHSKLQSGSPTSCNIESAFSVVAMSAGVKGRRSRLTLLNLEKEGLIRFNKNI